MTDNMYRPHPAEILRIEPQTAIDWTFRLRWPEAPKPGQFYQVSVPRVGEAPISVCDWGEGWVDLTIRQVGEVTSAIFDMGTGDTLFMRGPYGNGFPMDTFAGNHVVIAAGGTGLAPVKGMIRRLLGLTDDGRPAGQLDIVAGFKSPRDILFGSDLDEWSRHTRLLTTVDRADDQWDGRTGLITTLVPELDLRQNPPDAVVVVGPPLMMTFTVQAFLEQGVRLDQIWVSYERRMSCGVGKCGHCKIVDTYICLEGPVFNASEAQWLMD